MQRMSAFSYYLRTGRRRTDDWIERKYNHWHDPDDGRFTFSGQGRYFSGGSGSDAPAPAGKLAARNGQLGERRQAADFGGGNWAESSPPPVKLAQNSPNPRIRMRGNGGPPLHVPRTLQQAFPGLRNAPGGAIIGLADNILDLTGPAHTLTAELARAHSNALIREIQRLDPNFPAVALEPGGFPSTVIGQANFINKLRLERAKAYYRKGELRPLQVETLKFLQRHVDQAYERGLAKLKAGQLPIRLCPQEALGNYVDREVRRELTQFYNGLGISSERGQLVQVNRRAYHVPERSYSRPDSRIGNISFDWSLTDKNLTTPQIRNFFRSDFQPAIVVIVRPSQLGRASSYAITKPTGR